MRVSRASLRRLYCVVCTSGSPDLFLASGAQDHRVRVWRIADNSAMATGGDGDGESGAAAASSSVEAFIASLSKPKSFTIQGESCHEAQNVVCPCGGRCRQPQPACGHAAAQQEAARSSSPWKPCSSHTSTGSTLCVRPAAVAWAYHNSACVAVVFVLTVAVLLLVPVRRVLHQVRWQPPRRVDGTLVQPMCVVTASMDRTMLVWQPEEDGGVWSPVVRVGEVRCAWRRAVSCVGEACACMWASGGPVALTSGGTGGVLHAVSQVGGNTLGFFGGVMSPAGQHVMAHGYHGSLHTWSRHSTDAESKSTEAGDGAGAGAGAGGEAASTAPRDNDLSGHWEPVTAASGHFGPVMDAAWGTGDDYLVTASTDQTCRLFAPWWAPGARRGVWRELARPQVRAAAVQLRVCGHRWWSDGLEGSDRCLLEPRPLRGTGPWVRHGVLRGASAARCASQAHERCR